MKTKLYAALTVLAAVIPHSQTNVLAGDTKIPLLADVAAQVEAPAAGSSRSSGTTRQLPPKSESGRYELGPGDVLRVRFYERDDLSGDFRVRPDGRIGLPLLGVFHVLGKDPDEFEQDLVAAFIGATGRKPSLLVEVHERRPFYVAGIVARPGQYQYVPNMTVLHAVTIAGGVGRGFGGDLSPDLVFNVSRETGVLRTAVTQGKYYIARLHRLYAERDGRDSMPVPQALIELVGQDDAEQVTRAENQVLRQRREAYLERKRSHHEVFLRIRTEIKELEAQAAQISGQVRIHKSHLTDLTELRDKGLSRRPDVLNLQSLIAGFEGRVFEIRAAVARAQRNLEDSERTLLSVDLEQAAQNRTEIVEAERQVALAATTHGSARMALTQLTGLPAEMGQSGEQAYQYTIVRRNSRNQIEQIDVDEYTVLLPGDALRVTLKSAPNSSNGTLVVFPQKAPEAGGGADSNRNLINLKR
jgi:Polysaccharide biosynthesis/export protein